MRKQKENFRETRRELLENLGEVIETALTKFALTRTKNSTRQGWARVVISAVGESGKILRDFEIADLVDRVESLEAQRK